MTRQGYRVTNNKRRGAGYSHVYWESHANIEMLPEEERPRKVFKTCEECGSEFYVYRSTNLLGWSKIRHCGPKCFSAWRSRTARENGIKNTGKGNKHGFNFNCPICGIVTKIAVRKLAVMNMGGMLSCHACGFSVPYRRHEDALS